MSWFYRAVGYADWRFDKEEICGTRKISDCDLREEGRVLTCCQHVLECTREWILRGQSIVNSCWRVKRSVNRHTPSEFDCTYRTHVH